MKVTNMRRSVVILRWNPAFSSFGTEAVVCSLEGMNAHPRGHMDWSVFDYKNVHEGDDCDLSTTELETAIPDFNWRSGHSGEVLAPVQARKLKRLWNGFLVSNAETLAGNAYNRNAGEWNCFGIADMASRKEGR